MGDPTATGAAPATEDLALVEVDERFYKGDLELIHLYQSLSMGLLRAALTGIALVGLLIAYFYFTASETRPLFAASLALMAVTVGLALAHRYCLSQGFQFHLKSIKCSKSLTRQAEAAPDRVRRSRHYKAGRYLLIAVCLTFLAGTAVLAWAFLASIRVM